MRLKYLFNVIGLVLVAIGSMMALPIIVALIYRDFNSILPFLSIGLVSVCLGLCLKYFFKIKRETLSNLKKTEGLGIVLISWIIFSIIAALPYLFYGFSVENALFEGISGATTTGATILTHFDYPKVLFFWRSLTQWLGGMGIIVLFIAILPQFAVAGRQMLFAEAPGPTEDKLTPRIRHTATALWSIYLILTVLQIIVLVCLKMPVFDSVCNSLSTISTGGFSPSSQSIMGYNSLVINWVFIVFMFLSGVNFALFYRMIINHEFKIFSKNEEFKVYFWIVAIISLLIVLAFYFNGDVVNFKTFTDSVFTTVSVITSTGFATVDYVNWAVSAQVILFMCLFFGSCAGSTGGGIKVIRVLVLFKYIKNEILKITHPNAVTNIKINEKVVNKDVISQILAFIMFYILLFLISAILVSIIENNVVIGLGGALVSLNIVGPAFGSNIGPMGNFNDLSCLTKLIFMLNMLVGRLELIPFLVLLNKDFWVIKK